MVKLKDLLTLHLSVLLKDKLNKPKLLLKVSFYEVSHSLQVTFLIKLKLLCDVRFLTLKQSE